MTVKYWIGDAGLNPSNWNDTNFWSLISGGMGGAGVPGSTDDVIFDGNSPNCTLDIAADIKSFTLQAAFAGTFDANDFDISTAGNMTLTGGTVLMGSGTWTLKTVNNITFKEDGAAVTPETSTLKFTTAAVAGSVYINVLTASLYNLTLAIVTRSFYVSGSDFSVANDLTLTSYATILSGTISVSGNVIIDTSTSVASTYNGIISMVGGGNKTVTANIANAVMGFCLEINKPGGSVTFSGTYRFLGDTWTYVAGTVNTVGSTIGFIRNNAGTTQTVDSVGMEFDDVSVTKVTATLAVVGTMTINGDFTIITVGTINGGVIEVLGNVTVPNIAISGNADLWFGGGNAQSISLRKWAIAGEVVVSKTVGTTATLTAASIINTTLAITTGILDLDGNNIQTGTSITVTDTLVLKGSETITTVTLTVDPTSSTIIYKDAAVEATVTNLSKTFYNLTLGASKTHKFGTGAGNRVTINGALVSNGLVGTKAILRSTSDGTKWQLDLNGSETITNNVDVKDSDASYGTKITCVGSTDSGNNTNWEFIAMAVSSIAPSDGPVTGGNSVTITGIGFATGALAYLDNVVASNVIVVGSTSITCDTPAGVAGVVDVKVVNLDSSEATLTNGWEYTVLPTEEVEKVYENARDNSFMASGLALLGKGGAQVTGVYEWFNLFSIRDIAFVFDINGAVDADCEIIVQACLSGGESHPATLLVITPTGATVSYTASDVAWDSVRCIVTKLTNDGKGSKVLCSGR